MVLQRIGGEGIEDQIKKNLHNRRAYIDAVVVFRRDGVCI